MNKDTRLVYRELLSKKSVNISFKWCWGGGDLVQLFDNGGHVSEMYNVLSVRTCSVVLEVEGEPTSYYLKNEGVRVLVI